MNSLKQVIFILFFCLPFHSILNAQSLQLDWHSIIKDTAQTSRDFFSDTKIDKDGNIYQLGTIENTFTSFNFKLVKYSSSGNVLWKKNAFEHFSTLEATAMAVDTFGNVIVGGNKFGVNGGSYNYLLAKHDSTGSLIWEVNNNASTDNLLEKIEKELQDSSDITATK